MYTEAQENDENLIEQLWKTAANFHAMIGQTVMMAYQPKSVDAGETVHFPEVIFVTWVDAQNVYFHSNHDPLFNMNTGLSPNTKLLLRGNEKFAQFLLPTLERKF